MWFSPPVIALLETRAFIASLLVVLFRPSEGLVVKFGKHFSHVFGELFVIVANGKGHVAGKPDTDERFLGDKIRCRSHMSIISCVAKSIVAVHTVVLLTGFVESRGCKNN